MHTQNRKHFKFDVRSTKSFCIHSTISGKKKESARTGSPIKTEQGIVVSRSKKTKNNTWQIEDKNPQAA
jgi:hypothetical protein